MPVDDRTDRWMDRHIILPLRLFETVSCGHILCAQLCAAAIAKKWVRPDTFGHRHRRGRSILALQTHARTQIQILCPPPSSPNINYPLVVNSYLPIGHPGQDIPLPEPGGSIVVVPEISVPSWWTGPTMKTKTTRTRRGRGGGDGWETKTETKRRRGVEDPFVGISSMCEGGGGGHPPS